MAAYIRLIEGADDDQTITLHDKEFGYHIADGGVLQIIRQLEDGEIIVEKEYGPTAWLNVTGTRYLGSTASLGGDKGVFATGSGGVTIA